MIASRATLAEIANTLKAVRAAQRQLTLELTAAKAEIEALRSSTSWRLTAPLRAVVEALCRLRRKKVAVPALVPEPDSDLVPDLVPFPEPAPEPPPMPAVAAADLKSRFRAVAARRLTVFLASTARIALPTSDDPQVSVVIVLYNGAELTLAHLKSLVPALVQAKCEVIIVDNASTDRTHALLDRVDGARIIFNESNLHFLRAVNQAAKLARGRQLLMVNNDTEIESDSIAIAQRLIDADGTIGAIGGKIVLLDGTLQEAGCIIWDDGSAHGYGRGYDPDHSAVGFRRDVDYCSGAFLMVSRALFDQLGGFDQRYAPAYYEETDLCMRIRAAGYRVVYEPTIQLRHFEFGSAPSACEPFTLQARNREIFRSIHGATLRSAHFPSGTNPTLARGRPVGPRLLMIGDRAPLAIDGVAQSRSLALLKAALLQGSEIGFYQLYIADLAWMSGRSLLPPTLELVGNAGLPGLAAFLEERQDIYDAVLIAGAATLDQVRRACPSRLLAETQIFYEPDGDIPQSDAGTAVATEQDRLRWADAVIVGDRPAAEQYKGLGASHIHVIGAGLEARPSEVRWEQRKDILFRATGRPAEDVDALEFIITEVMPELDRLIGETYRLFILGAIDWDASAVVPTERIVAVDRSADLPQLFAQSRVLIRPALRDLGRAAATVREAASYGVPSVTAAAVADRLGWQAPGELLTAVDAGGFAMQTALIYRDHQKFETIAAACLARIAADPMERGFTESVTALLTSIAVRKSAVPDAVRSAALR
jgi:GT2 family glycosyltransferase